MTRQLLAEMILPFPPSLNHYWRKDRGGMHISEDGKKYIARVQQLALLNGRGDTEYSLKVHQQPEPKQKLKVCAVFHCPDNARRDLDNLFKVLFDCMTKAKVWHDDSQVFELDALKLLKRDYTNGATEGWVSMEIYGEDEWAE